MGKSVVKQAPTVRERDTVQFGNKIIEYTVTRSPRRKKTIGITLDGTAGVLVAAPLRTSSEQIREIILKRAGWIVQKATLGTICPRRKEFVSGESLLYLGHEAPLAVEHANIRRVAIAFDQFGFAITAPAHLDGEKRRRAIEAALVNWYKSCAARHLVEQVERWSKAAGLVPSRVLVRNQRRRWGSCSSDGSLRFNWRIIMAPPALIDYLIVHELVHLRILNHSKLFWAEVARLMPDYKARRSLLKEIEPRLTV